MQGAGQKEGWYSADVLRILLLTAFDYTRKEKLRISLPRLRKSRSRSKM
jgi:hypothetical protein